MKKNEYELQKVNESMSHNERGRERARERERERVGDNERVMKL